MNQISRKTDTLIIGFGLTAIPLIRELERSGQDYTVLSSGPSIWDRLEAAGRLDFDLVSSYMSSVYSFELARTKTLESRFPTAREYHAFIKRHQQQYAANVVEDWVTEVESHETHSLVHTKSGTVYEAKNLVIATGFRRKVHGSILEYDFDRAQGRTIVITTMGDSANLLISKLVPRGNRIILLNHGFFCLDKLVTHRGKSFALDDVEMHNIGDISGYLYKMVTPQGQILAANSPRLCKPFLGSNLFVKHPLTCRDLERTPALNMSKGSPINATLPNGLKITKYWAIDAYKELFESTLEQSIADGYLLSDIAYFIDRGLVEIWPMKAASLDREHRVVRWNDEAVAYDDLIEGDQEVPNLPAIKVVRAGQPSYDYQYAYRDCFLGIAPPELPNTFLLGYTRPMTGGLNNIAEMQCLLTHELITNDEFRRKITHDLGERIKAYNAQYYVSPERSGSDNLVFYGQYTERLARLLGIESRLSQCRSLEDVSIHYFFPNSPCKYRRTGRYAVEGLAQLVPEIHRAHDGFSISSSQVLNYCLMLATALAALVQLYRTQVIPFPLWVLVPLLLVVLLGPVLPLANTNSNRINTFTNLGMVVGLGLTLWLGHPLVPLASLGLNFLAVYVCRKLRISRPWFNDLRFKEKPEYTEFYARYRETFRKVFGVAD